jgi:hypothetical protein
MYLVKSMLTAVHVVTSSSYLLEHDRMFLAARGNPYLRQTPGELEKVTGLG